jgi:PAS domain S-box-containing protein
MREAGIDPVGSISWGTHFCIFYQTKADLRDILVPYFKAGLENNEFCMWVTSEPLPARDAKESLQEVVKNLDEYIENEQMEILDNAQWYTKSGKFEVDKVLQGWIEKEHRALERGFAGLRVAGNAFWLGNEAWRAFADYETTTDRAIGNYRIIAACTYSLDRCGASEIMDVANRHQFALIKREGKLEVIESAERKWAEDAIKSLAKFPAKNPNPIVRIGGNGTVLYANKAAGLLLQSLGGAVGSPVPTLWGNWVTQALATQTAQAIDVEHDGRVYALDVIPITEEGYVIVYGHDITEHKRMDRLLHNQHDLAVALSGTSRLKEGARLCLEAVLNISGMDSGGFYLVDKASGALDLIFHQGLSSDFVKAVAHYAADSANAKLVLAGNPVHTEHLALWVPLGEAERREGLRAMAVVPVSHEGQVIACLNIASHALDEVPAFTRDALETVVAQTSNAIVRLQAEEALTEGEWKLWTLFEMLPVGVSILDAERKMLYSNRALERILDISREGLFKGDYKTRTWLRPDGTLMPAEEFASVRAIKEEKAVYNVETGVVKEDGKVVWTSVSAVPVAFPDWKVVIVTSDITEHKRSEEALKKSAQLLRDTGEMAKVGAWELDLSTKEVVMTEEVCRIHGVEPGYKPKLKEAIKFYAPESIPALTETLKKTIETGEPYDLESLFIPSGSKDKIWVRGLGRAVYSGGKIVKLAGTFQNIDKYKRAEQALWESEQKYRTLFEDSRDVIVIVTQEGKFIDINKAGLELFGYAREELVDMKVQALWANPDERTGFQQEVERKGFVRRYEAKLRRKDGTEMDCLLTSTLWQATDGSVLGYQSIIHDITGRKRRDAERRLLLADLRAKNRELESFVYTISHDLKAPLVSLSGFSAALQKEIYSQLSKEGKHYLERIQANVGHMGGLIASLLELSRIGLVIGAIEEVDVAALLREIWDKLAVTLEKAGVEFRVREPLPIVRADQGRMRQVFANLIDNAIKFRSAERALRIEVGCRQEGSFYRFHVADNGIGIAPQYHEQIFAPFRSLHPEIEGAGMGLAIVKKIVEHHGGRVWVESPSDWLRAGDEGTGATFYFTLPIECGIEPRDQNPKPEGLS